MNLEQILTNGFYLNYKICMIILFILVVAWWVHSSKPVLNLAPGPKAFPILGHLPLLMKDAHLTLMDYRKKYGPIFSVKFGRRYCVILGDFDTIKETYQMEGLTTRVSELLNFSTEFKTIIELNGKEWQDRRRFIMTVIRRITVNREKTAEDIIQEQVTKLLESMEIRDLTKEVHLSKLLAIVTNNTMFTMMCGKSFDEDAPVMKLLLEYNDHVFDYFRMLSLSESLKIPKFICKLFFPKMRTVIQTMKKFDEFIRNEIAEHEDKLNQEIPNNFIDFCLEPQSLYRSKNCYDYDKIRGDCQILILAGSDTVRITMEWAILLLAKYSNIQDKIYHEIVDVLGHRRPTWEDHTSLPFFEAFLMESQRFHPTVPLNVIRRSPRNLKIKGYDVPKGSWILANFWDVHHDPNLWTEPEKFNPNRFLNKEGNQATEPKFWIPFSIGKRICLGDKLARLEMFITLASLIQQYRILPSDSGLCFEGVDRLNYSPKHVEVKFQKRIADPLEIKKK